jgi:Spy/CpxP family protein refolding chaperone
MDGHQRRWTMKRTALLYLLTFSLAINGAVAATLVFSWWKDQAHANAITLAQKPVINFLREDLSLTAAQTSRIVEEVDRTRPKFLQLRDLMDSNRVEMMRLVSTTPVNMPAVESKVNDINRIQGEIRQIAVGTVIKIVESLPSEAKSKFGAYLQERGRICDGCGPGTGRSLFPDPKSE